MPVPSLVRDDARLVSVVIPCYYSERTIRKVVTMTRDVLVDLGYRYEFVLVNDGSTDGTFDQIRQLCDEDPCVCGVNFAKNFGQHSAIIAGLRHVHGDYVMLMDDDMQTHPSHPPGEDGGGRPRRRLRQVPPAQGGLVAPPGLRLHALDHARAHRAPQGHRGQQLLRHAPLRQRRDGQVRRPLRLRPGPDVPRHAQHVQRRGRALRPRGGPVRLHPQEPRQAVVQRPELLDGPAALRLRGGRGSSGPSCSSCGSSWTPASRWAGAR